ncbi:MAG: hypothetical protein CO114_00115 [Euryarchaeota archaeon CG_4_9_14_3_um_filter_38_12]|nr:MAG: hypothetical protein CO114_00115 [Euryarchaeota archaeon CG_4_9_14_3_um_filter_38_12]
MDYKGQRLYILGHTYRYIGVYLKNYYVYPKYNGKPVIPDHTRGVLEELEHERLDLDDVVEILETGFDCQSGKRKKEIVEKCTQKKDKIIKIVAEDIEDYWLLRHVGSFKIARKKRKRRYKIWKN